jgi:hypothetical protein
LDVLVEAGEADDAIVGEIDDLGGVVVWIAF